MPIQFTPTPLRRNLKAALRDLDSTRPDVRASAARDLGIAGQELPQESTDALLPLLTDKNSKVRGETALALGALGARNAVEPLVPLLSDDESEVRQYAALALGQIGGERALGRLQNAMTSSHADVRYQALLSIATIDRAQGIEACMSAIDDADVWIASEAILRVGQLLDEGDRDLGVAAGVREALRDKITSKSGRISLCAAMTLERLGDDRATSVIIDFLRKNLVIEDSEDMGDLRLEAIERLGNVGGDNVRAVLEPVAWKVLPSIERDVARASLARMGDPAACEKLVKQLRSSWQAQRQAAVSLVAAGRVVQAVPALTELLPLTDVDPGSVVQALAAIGTDAALDSLDQFADGTLGEHEIREEAREAALEVRARRAKP